MVDTGIHAFKGYLGAGKSGAVSDLSFAAVARDRFCRFVDLDITEDNQAELDPTSGRAEFEEAFLGPFDARIRGTLEGSVEGILTRLLQSLMGTAAVGAPVSGAYPHTFTVGDELTTGNRLTFEAKYGTKAESEVLNGIVNRVRYDFGNRGMVRIGMEALCALPTYSSSPTAATLPAANATRLSQYMHTVTFGGGSLKPRSGSVEIVRNLQEDDYTVDSRARRDASYGGFEVNLVLELLWADMTQRRRFWGGTGLTTPGNVPSYYECNVKGEHPTVIGGAEKYTAEFDMDKIYMTGALAPMRGRDAIIETLNGRAIYDATNGSLTAKVKNTQATA